MCRGDEGWELGDLERDGSERGGYCGRLACTQLRLLYWLGGRRVVILLPGDIPSVG